MKSLAASALAILALATTLAAQQPAGLADQLHNLTSEPATHTAFTLDHDMLQTANGYLNGGEGPASQLNSITIENFRFHNQAFYIPENMAALTATFRAAGWQHLVDQHASPQDGTTPQKPLTDLWLHFQHGEIDDITVLLRGPREMTAIEVSGALRPLDLVHLSGHFGIPKVDPGAIMVPAPPGK
jgi:hypothetical protein